MFPFEIFPVQLFPRELFLSINSIISVSLSDTITFTQNVSPNQVLNRNISQSLTFTQDASLHNVISKSIAQSLTLTQNVSAHSTILSVFVSNSLTFTQNASLHSSIRNILLSNSLTFTQDVRSHSPVSRVSISDSLTFTQNVSADSSIRNIHLNQSLVFTQNVSLHFSIRNLFVTQFFVITDSFQSNYKFIYDTLNFTQNVSRRVFRHKNINQSLTFTQHLDYIRAKVRRLKNRLTFIQSLSVNKVKKISIIDRLEFVDALTKANKTLNVSITQVLLFKGGGGYHSDAPQITKVVDSTPFIYSDVIALKVQRFIVLTGKSTIILPSPLFGDSRVNIASLNPLRMVDGTVYTYIKTTNRQKLIFRFELKRRKAAELQKFLDDNDLEWLTMDNFKAERWMVRVTNNPIVFTATGRGYVCPNNREVHQIELEFEGFRISGSSTSC